MHIHTRFQVLAAFIMLALIPASVGVRFASSLTEKYKAVEELDAVMDNAENVHTSGRGLMYERDRAQAIVDEVMEELEGITLERSAARRNMVVASRRLKSLYEEHGFDITDEGEVYRHMRLHDAGGDAPEESLLEKIKSFFQVSLLRLRGKMPEVIHAAAPIQHPLLLVHERAKRLNEDSKNHSITYNTAIRKYNRVWKRYLEAKGGLKSARARITHVQRVTNEVQSQISALQRELARIDAQLVARLERELIEKGLMTAQPGERSDGRIRSKQAFRWPVVGRISAGFYQASYRAFFGVPHKGIDIVVPQGTPVASSADGVMYLARDGGKYGYSYVLVGHRNGLATLYGHLSSINVSTGQEVAGGTILGFSGGTPGMWGSGPMTTGAHLHFEVIANGTHISPTSVLP